MSETNQGERRAFLRACTGVVGCAAVLPLVTACGGDAGEDPKPRGGSAPPEGSVIALPKGVKWDLANKHTPRCTLSADGDDWVVDVVVPHVVNKTHYVSGVKIVGPEAPFAEIAAHEYTAEQIDAADDAEWKHVFRFPKSAVPDGVRYLVAYSHCNKHGDYGVSQGLFG